MNDGIVGLGKLSKKKLIELVKLNPFIIWELPWIDEKVLRAAIKSDPMVVFDKNDRLHPQFDPITQSAIVRLIIKTIAEQASYPNWLSRGWFNAHCQDWRVLAFYPDPPIGMLTRLAKNNILALEYVDDSRLSEVVFWIADSINDIDGYLKQDGIDHSRVIFQVKRILLCKCKSAWIDPKVAAPYINKYISLASDNEIEQFISDDRFCYLVSETIFVSEPPDLIKKILIGHKGYRFYMRSMGSSWALSKELSLWVAGRLNEDSNYELPDILEMPFPGVDEKMVFVSTLLGIPFVDAEFNNSELIAAIDLIKPKMHCEKIAWLCWAFGNDASDTVTRLLVAKLSGLSASDCGHLSIKDRNRALGRLAKHYSDQDIRAALLIIGKVFPEIALLQASVELLYDDLGECCKHLKRVLPGDAAGPPNRPHGGVAIPEIEELLEDVY